MSIPEHFKINSQPVADPKAVILHGNARFSLLSERMIRMEYSPAGNFEDRASQAVWFRKRDVPAYQVEAMDQGRLVIRTKFLELTYTGGEFAADSLSIMLNATSKTWHFGDAETANLGGTARTLDEADGPVDLSPGLVSRDGWSVLDDSQSLVFNEDSWLVDREAPDGALDLYFLAYGHDYLGCLREFNGVVGQTPMIPRWALGNWWSRYWEYTQDELAQLMQDFEEKEVPLGVCIIDMDWHLTQTGNQSSGWTGYTWNRKLIPDPEGLLRFLHEKGLHVALNLHPADGVYPHEEMYDEMAKRMGIDPATKKPVEFDIANPEFVNAYFEVLHHPMEEKGIDFWWMDWQQGRKSRMKGLDPLWWLNHLHFYDLGRDGKKRPFIFSRWGGHGNQRYPIGFSGDTVVSWESLAFQPFFTATASNVNFGWWSHDIGGHMEGVEDGELYARWVQYGVFSPILRVHSTKNPFQDRRPWGYDAEVFEVTRDAMQLRHALIPYLYSMSYRYLQDGVPPILPMYYTFPEREEAYHCPNQYLFGSELLAAPFTAPRDAHTGLSRQVVWLPGDGWYGLWDGQFYANGWHSVHGALDEIPVFAKAGAIIPLGPRLTWGGLEEPEELVVLIFPGEDGKFDLYEDHGDRTAYQEINYSLTHFSQLYLGDRLEFYIEPVRARRSLAIPFRTYVLKFRGINPVSSVVVKQNREPIELEHSYDPVTGTLTFRAVRLESWERLKIELSIEDGPLAYRDDRRLETCQKLVQAFKMGSTLKEMLYNRLPEIIQDPELLGKFRMVLTESQLRALGETILEAGADLTTSSGEGHLIIWNNRERPSVERLFSAMRKQANRYEDSSFWMSGAAGAFEAYRVGKDIEEKPWDLEVRLGSTTSIRYKSEYTRTTNRLIGQ